MIPNPQDGNRWSNREEPRQYANLLFLQNLKALGVEIERASRHGQQ